MNLNVKSGRGDSHHLVERGERLDTADTERVILGAILLDNQRLRETSPLGTMDFSKPFHQAVFAAMLELAEDGRPIDPVLIHAAIRNAGGDPDWSIASVTNLTYGLPAMKSIREYVDVLKGAAMTRRVVSTAEQLVSRLASRSIDLKQFLAEIAALENEYRATHAEETDSFKPLSLVMQEEAIPMLDAYFRRDGEATRALISSGFPEIDSALGGGFYRSDFVAIVAPPKSAKSALAIQMGTLMAKAGETVALLSLEMSNVQNAIRMIAQESYRQANGNDDEAVSAGRIYPGMFDSDYRRASIAASALFLDNFFICQKPLAFREVKKEVRRLVAEHSLSVLIVDYWQLVQNENRQQTRAESLAEIAKGLKALGQELGIVVIALGQFNQEGLRKREQGGELSANYLEGSGELAKSANIVLTVDIKEGDLKNPAAPREGTLTFRPCRSAADARLSCLFFGRYLTVEIV